MRSNSRLAALLAALALARRRGIRGRLRQQRRQHHRRWRRRGAHGRLRRPLSARSRNSARPSPNSRASTSNWSNAIAEKIGRTPEFKDTSFDTIFRDLAQGKFDMVASATTITDEREETVDFTNPYYLPSAQSIVVKKGNPGHQDRSRTSTARSSASSRARPARNTSKKKSTPRNSAPSRRAPTRSRRSRRGRSTPS